MGVLRYSVTIPLVSTFLSPSGIGVGSGSDAGILGDTEANYLSLVANDSDGSIAVRSSSSMTLDTTFNDASSILVQSGTSAKVTIQEALTLATTASGDVAQQWDIALSKWGILSEPAATNILLQSADITTTWIQLGDSSRTANTSASPDGTTTADLITGTVSGGQNDGTAQTSKTVTNVAHTLSIFAKAGTNSWIEILVASNDAYASYVGSSFNISTGAVGTTRNVTYTLAGTSVVALANGWYRISITTSALTANSTTRVDITTSSANNFGSGGSGTGTVSVWGAQLEIGSVATSYVATTTGTVTRAADVINVDTDNFPWSDTSGTIYLDYKPFRVDAGTRYGWSAWVDANNRISYFGSTANPTLGNTTATTTDVTIDLGTLVVNTRTQITGAYATNDFSGSQDGAAPTPDVTATLTTNYDPLYIGTTGATTTELNGLIYRLLYVPYQRETVNGDLETWRFNF